jgi:hypothetical protein
VVERDDPAGALHDLHDDTGVAGQMSAKVMGRELGVPTPTHEFIYASLLPGELKARAAAKI